MLDVHGLVLMRNQTGYNLPCGCMSGDFPGLYRRDGACKHRASQFRGDG